MLYIENLPKSHSVQTSDTLICDLCVNSVDNHRMNQQYCKFFVTENDTQCPVRYKKNSCLNNSATSAERSHEILSTILLW